MGRLIASSGTLAVGANSTSAEQVPADLITCPEAGTLILCAACSAVTGAPSANLLVGGESIINNKAVASIRSTISVVYPEDLMVQTKVNKGDALSLKFSWGGTGGNIAYTLILI